MLAFVTLFLISSTLASANFLSRRVGDLPDVESAGGGRGADAARGREQGVDLNPGRSMSYQAQVTRGGKKVSLGSFATAEEAALCFALSPEGQAQQPAPMTEEVDQVAKVAKQRP